MIHLFTHSMSFAIPADLSVPSEYANWSSDLRKPLSRAQIIFGHCHKYLALINLHIALLPINNYTDSARTYHLQIKIKKNH